MHSQTYFTDALNKHTSLMTDYKLLINYVDVHANETLHMHMHALATCMSYAADANAQILT